MCKAKYETAEACLEAVKQCGAALQYVPERFKTFELCVEAVKSGFYVLDEFVPEEFNKEDILMEVIEQKWGFNG